MDTQPHGSRTVPPRRPPAPPSSGAASSPGGGPLEMLIRDLNGGLNDVSVLGTTLETLELSCDDEQLWIELEPMLEASREALLGRVCSIQERTTLQSMWRVSPWFAERLDNLRIELGPGIDWRNRERARRTIYEAYLKLVTAAITAPHGPR